MELNYKAIGKRIKIARLKSWPVFFINDIVILENRRWGCHISILFFTGLFTLCPFLATAIQRRNVYQPCFPQIPRVLFVWWPLRRLLFLWKGRTGGSSKGTTQAPAPPRTARTAPPIPPSMAEALCLTTLTSFSQSITGKCRFMVIPYILANKRITAGWYDLSIKLRRLPQCAHGKQ